MRTPLSSCLGVWLDSADRAPHWSRQDHRRRYNRRSRTAREAARHRCPRTGQDVLVAGRAHPVRHDGFGRSRGAYCRGHASLRGGRAGSARPPCRQGLLTQRRRHRAEAGIGGLGPGLPTVLDRLHRRRGRGPQSKARDVAGKVRATLAMARIVTAAAPAGRFPACVLTVAQPSRSRRASLVSP